MRNIILILLFLCGMSFACSPFFTQDFCNEIDFWNIQSSKYNYKYFEIAQLVSQKKAEREQTVQMLIDKISKVLMNFYGIYNRRYL